MTSCRALFRYFPPSCLYMLGMCVVWLGYKMGDWLVLSVFWILCCRKKMSFMRCRSLHCTHKIWGKSRSRSLSSPPPNRDIAWHCRKVTFAKRKEKNREGWGQGRGLSHGMKTQMHQSPYLQTNRKYKHYCIWNQVKTPGGAKFRYCLLYIYFPTKYAIC